MIPLSRFDRSRILRDALGRSYLSDRTPYRYQPHPDNREHRVTQNDTLATLAGLYFAPLPRACGLWWAIAEFQPDPIIDPLLSLHDARETVTIPSLRVLTDIILPGSSEGRGSPW
jgi:hypothetical protein